MHQALNRVLAAAAAAAVVWVLPVLTACGSGRQEDPPRVVPRTPAAPSAPSARDTRLAGMLPLVAGAWGEQGGSHAPPERLTWQRDRSASRDEPLSAEVTGPGRPWYASFMVHKTLDQAGVPKEDTANQAVLACGNGITEPGCRITRGVGDGWRIETSAPAPESHPYRVLYVQWPSDGPGRPEKWASWQLPTP